MSRSLRPLHKVLVGSLILLAMAAGFHLGYILNPPQAPVIPVAPTPKVAAKDLIGQRRPDFELPDLAGHMRSISEWDGKPLLINFWATWCHPCREEIPEFMRVRAEYPGQFEIIGVALDLPDMVAEFNAEMNISYPLLYGGEDADQVMRNYGNYLGGLPYSVLLDVDGKIQHIHARRLPEDTLRTLINDLLVADKKKR